MQKVSLHIGPFLMHISQASLFVRDIENLKEDIRMERAESNLFRNQIEAIEGTIENSFSASFKSENCCKSCQIF